MKKLLLLCLLSLSLSPVVYAARSLKSKLAVVREIYKSLETRKYFEDFLEELLKDIELFTPEELDEYRINQKSIKTLNETQLIQLVNKYEQVYNLLDRYTQEVIKSKKSPEKLLKVRDSLRKEASNFFKKQSVAKDLKELFKSTEPFKIEEKFKKDAVKTYWTHEIINRELKETDKNFSHYITNEAGEALPVQKPDNLIDVIVKNIESAKSDISINVYEFSNKEIADALIAKKKTNPKVKITVGIDLDAIEHSDAVKEVAERLKAAGIDVKEIDSVGINHQKMIVIDHDLKGESKVILSSGNFTNSGIHPLGDFANLPLSEQKRILESEDAQKVLKYAKPNSNHLAVIKSDSFAATIKHNMDYTFSGLRGTQYPVSGAFQIIDTSSEKPISYFLAFAPQGAIDDINYNFIGKMIREGKGPEIDMMIFAHSSETISNEILEKIKFIIANGQKPILRFVGDPPFAKREWSQFLVMAGYKATVDPYTGITIYKEDKKSKFLQELGPELLEEIRQMSVFVGSSEYGNNWVQLSNGERIPLTAKIHSKVVRSGDWTLFVSSFNFSKNAENSNETIAATNNPRVVERISGATEYLAIKAKQESRTLVQVLKNANVSNKKKIRVARKLRKKLISQISEGADDVLIQETVREMKKVLGLNKTRNLIFTLGQEIKIESPFQKTNFIFEFDNNIIKFDTKKFTYDDFIKTYEGDNPSKLMGSAFNEIQWALKANNGNQVKVYSKIVSNEDLEKIFAFLKKKNHIESLIPTKNFIQVADTSEVVKLIEGEVSKLSSKKIPKKYLYLIGADGSTREKLHLFSFSARSKEDVTQVTRALAKKSKKLTKTVKIGIFNNNTLSRTKPDNSVMNTDGSLRELDLNELLDWQKTLLTNCKIYLSKRGK